MQFCLAKERIGNFNCRFHYSSFPYLWMSNMGLGILESCDNCGMVNK